MLRWLRRHHHRVHIIVALLVLERVECPMGVLIIASIRLGLVAKTGVLLHFLGGSTSVPPLLMAVGRLMIWLLRLLWLLREPLMLMRVKAHETAVSVVVSCILRRLCRRNVRVILHWLLRR